jgi:hypothetical protein
MQLVSKLMEEICEEIAWPSAYHPGRSRRLSGISSGWEGLATSELKSK